MPTFEADDIDIDVDEFYNAMSSKEKEEMADLLREDGIRINTDDIERVYGLLTDDDKQELITALADDGLIPPSQTLEDEMKLEFITSVFNRFSLPELEERLK